MADELELEVKPVAPVPAVEEDEIQPAPEGDERAVEEETEGAAQDDEEQDTAAARRAAIFDEDDEEDHDALPTFRRRTNADEDDADAAVLRRKKKKRYHSPSADAAAQAALADEQPAFEELHSNLTEAELRKLRTDKIIEDALRGGKKKGPRKKAGEDDLDIFADEEVAQLRTEMVTAADEDEDANRLKKPATHKLRLLPKVVATLQK